MQNTCVNNQAIQAQPNKSGRESFDRSGVGSFIRSGIKSFVRRQGHISNSQRAVLQEYWPLYGIGEYQAKRGFAKLSTDIWDFSTLFACSAPVVFEIGFGDGTSLLEMARSTPELNFIGIEVFELGLAKMLQGIQQHKLTNIKIVAGDAVEILRNNIADHALSAVNLFFPDPWPKSRHHKRRLIQPEFVMLLARKLQNQGKLYLATDWQNYAEHMLTVLESSPLFQNCYGAYHFAPRLTTRIITKYERKAKQAGRDIWDLCFQCENDGHKL